jgi:hypothetical protein
MNGMICTRRVRRHAQDADAAGGVLDDGEDVQACPDQRHRFDQVGGKQRLGLGAEEVCPGGGGPVGCGIDSGLAQAFPERGWGQGDRDPERQEFAVHSPISPAGVLAGQAQHQGADRPQRAGSAAAAGPGHRGVATGEQVAVPPEDRVGSDQQPQPPECRPGQRVQQRGQPRPIGRCEPDLPPVELTLHHGELMTQRQDLNVLVTIAAGQQSQQRERVGDTQTRQPKQHEPASSRSHRRR